MVDHDALVRNAVDDSEPRERRDWSDIVIEGALFLPNVAKLVSRLMRDSRMPIRKKVPVVAALGYTFLPIDLIPDAIPGVGFLDDMVVLSVAVDNLIASADPSLIVEHWDGSVDAWDLASSLMRSFSPDRG